MDFFAIATHGYFPTPTPTMTQRMAFAATWGYSWSGALSSLSFKGRYRIGMSLTTT